MYGISLPDDNGAEAKDISSPSNKNVSSDDLEMSEHDAQHPSGILADVVVFFVASMVSAVFITAVIKFYRMFTLSSAVFNIGVSPASERERDSYVVLSA